MWGFPCVRETTEVERQPAARSGQQPWDVEKTAQHLVLSDSFAARAGWPSGLGSSSDSEGVECSGYKRKGEVTFLSPTPNSARSDCAGLPLPAERLQGWLEAHFYIRRALTESSDPSKSSGSLDVNQQTTLVPNSSAFSCHNVVLRGPDGPARRALSC